MPLTTNAQPVPTLAMTRPAKAGPIMRAALNDVELRATALGKCSSPTNSATKVWRTGASSAAAEPNRECKHIDMPEPDATGNRKHSQRQSQHAHRRLREHQEFALVEVIRRKPCPRQQKKLRRKLQAHDDADGGRIVVRELSEYEPVLRDALHPCADVGDQRARCPHPVVEAAQGTEGAGRGILHERSGALPPWNFPKCRARLRLISKRADCKRSHMDHRSDIESVRHAVRAGSR